MRRGFKQTGKVKYLVPQEDVVWVGNFANKFLTKALHVDG